MMKRRLSSIFTPFYKILPFILVFYGLFWLVVDFYYANVGGILFFVLCSGLLFVLTSHLKSVYLNGDVLSVSNYWKNVEIPLADLENVDASSVWGWQPRTITIRLKSASEFGCSIVFVPRFGGFEQGEIADELRNLIAARSR